MKKILLTIIAATFMSSLCLAAEQAAPPMVIKAPPRPIETKIFTGKVESVSLPDAVKGTKSEITIVNENNQKLTFLVKGTTTIYDASSNTMLLGSVNKDSNVKIAYVITKEGVNEATSIRLQK
jgi:nitrous oxide reductase accessory protein NosL